LRRSSASAILPTMKPGRMAVFPHTGLAAHQFNAHVRRTPGAEWRPRNAPGQFGSHGGAAIGELIVRQQA
jgi:hypothetical protein